jgi:hypothetical protein
VCNAHHQTEHQHRALAWWRRCELPQTQLAAAQLKQTGAQTHRPSAPAAALSSSKHRRHLEPKCDVEQLMVSVQVSTSSGTCLLRQPALYVADTYREVGLYPVSSGTPVQTATQHTAMSCQ